jgi:dTMP kinase
LSDHAIHLLFSANRWEAAASMRADIEAGTTLIVDRYYYSGIVYSAAKGRADLSLEWARAPEVGLPRPDLCLFLDLDPEAAAARGGFGIERYERGELQEKVRELFYELMRTAEGTDITVIDAGHDMERVEGEIREKVKEVLRQRETMGPLRAVQ